MGHKKLIKTEALTIQKRSKLKLKKVTEKIILAGCVKFLCII